MTTVEWVAATGGALALALAVYQQWRARERAPRDTPVPPVAPRNSGAQAMLASTGRRRRHKTPAAPIADLRSAVAMSHEDREAKLDAEHLVDQLIDIRDATGAAEVIYWQWDPDRDALLPTVWSEHHAERPQHFDGEAWGSLAGWAAQARVVALDAGEGASPPVFAAAPVLDDTMLAGVLTVANASGLLLSRQKAKQWMPRYAAQFARLVALSEGRREYARRMRQSRALLAAVEKVQTHKTAEALAAAICETAVEVSSATSAALVRWRSEMQKGSVPFTTSGFRPPPFPLDAETLAFNACRDGMVLFLDDASHVDTRVSLMSDGDTGWRTGSVGVIPLRRANHVMGAIVVASADAVRITQDEVDNLGLLGAVSSGPLEMAWEIDEVSRRASTDGLTGLVNRRAFDEQLKRLLNETDRFGQPLAIILGDIDHFKRINDTWGHEAGDEVLRHVARKLTEGIRNVDVIARYGGEEIAVLLPQTSVAGATDLADRLRHSVEARPVKFKGEEISVTMSFGVASYPDAVPRREALFQAADRALYEAKNAGRNCVKSVVVASSQ